MFRPTQVLQALKSIIWSSNSIYASSPGLRVVAEGAVKDHYKNQQLDKRNVEKATIRYPVIQYYYTTAKCFIMRDSTLF